MMRSAIGVLGLALVSCILSVAACGGDDPAATTPGGGASSGSSGTTSSSGGASSSSGSTGDDDDADGGASSSGDGGVPGDPNVPPSCRGSTGTKSGVDTCGAAEPGNESCCKSLTLPTTKTRKLDRYEITTGRVRAFIEAIGKDNGGEPDVRKFAKDFAAKNPTSQLGTIAKDFPAQGAFGSYLDVLPDKKDPQGDRPLPVWLGAFPVDAINPQDGCYLSKGGVGAATYWQEPAVLKTYKIGYTAPPDGVRKYDASVLDKKAANCMPPLLLAAFCAWDGGELARTSDYREVWGKTAMKVSAAANAVSVFVPWETVLPWKQFNWRNGHDGPCPVGWPGCVAGDAPPFYSFPAGSVPANDDTPEIGAPGRFPKDVTKIVSDDGGGWFDVGGNLMEAAWPNTKLVSKDTDFCETAAGAGAGATACNRNQPGDPRPGTLRYKGPVPPMVLIGYSFEVHSRRAEPYLGAAADDETKIAQGDVRALHFQYGKVGGRCARVK